MTRTRKRAPSSEVAIIATTVSNAAQGPLKSRGMILLDTASVQDRDLLARLTGYFANLEARIKEGQGWLIFNANRARANRINRFMLDRLAEHKPFISYYVVPWRD